MSDKIYILVADGDEIFSAYTGEDSRKLAIEKACELLEHYLEIYELQSGETEHNCILKFDGEIHCIPETYNEEDRQIVNNHPTIKSRLEHVTISNRSKPTLSTMNDLDQLIDIIHRSTALGIHAELTDIGVNRRGKCVRPLGSVNNLMLNLRDWALDLIIAVNPNIRYALLCLQKTGQYPKLDPYRDILHSNHYCHLPFILRIDDYIEYIISHIDIDIFIDNIGFEPTGQTKNIIYALLDAAKLYDNDEWVTSRIDPRIKIWIVNIAKK